MKIGPGVLGRKSPSPIDKAHGLYNSLYYRTICDESLINVSVDVPSLKIVGNDNS